jgi:ABC-type antimicrobial peptide transport system permease subunit
MVLTQAIRLSLFGSLLGIAVSVVLGRALEGFLWGVSATDPATLLGTAAALGAASVAAAWAPGRRAGRTDPVTALRRD